MSKEPVLRTIWISSDLHLGHTKILQHEDRPWSDIDCHDQGLAENFCDTMNPGDHLWLLGDVAWHIDPLVKFMTHMQKHGVTSHLVRGNHDDRAAWKWKAGSASLGFQTKHEACFKVFKIAPQDELSGGKVEVYLSHYAHRVWRNSSHGALHLYGHSHGNLPEMGRSMDVGIMCSEWRPLAMDEIVRKLLKQPTTNHHPVCTKNDAMVAEK